MTISNESPRPLPWIRTPLLPSNVLSKIAGCRVFMKLDMFQPAGSFKSRGVGNLCRKALESRPPNSPPVRFYSSSGGNAGLAAVTAAKSLDQNCTVVVPETTSAFMKDKIRAAGGEVITHGASWKEADDHVRELLARDVKGVYCAPFDDPDIWEGNSSIIDEIVEQLGDEGDTLDAIIASVGGGGLLCGIQQGLETHGLQAETTVVAVETEGADSLSESLKAGELVTLPAITSIATSLGARTVAKRTFELARRRNVRSQVVSDKQAAVACCRLLDDERIAVEAACGASVAIIYEGLLKKLVPLTPESKVVLIVCGGSNINTAMLDQYKREYCTDEGTEQIERKDLI